MTARPTIATNNPEMSFIGKLPIDSAVEFCWKGTGVWQCSILGHYRQCDGPPPGVVVPPGAMSS